MTDQSNKPAPREFWIADFETDRRQVFEQSVETDVSYYSGAFSVINAMIFVIVKLLEER
jgi:hypothetical protein